jgi:AraC-like DNA-binding protein
MNLAQGSHSACPDPLSRYRLFRTSDAAEARERVAAVYCPHELKVLGGGIRGVDTCMDHLPLGNVSLNRLRYGPEVYIDADRLASFYLVMMPMQGRARVSCGQEALAATPESAAVISPTLPFFQTIEAGCDQLMVRIDRQALERTCAQHLGHELRQPLEFAAALDMRAPGGWPALLAYLIREADLAAPGLDSPLLRTPVEHLLLATLLHGQPHNYRAELQQPARPLAPAHVKRVEDYIETHADEPLTVADLAAYAGVSASALFAGFRDFRNTTPMAHLRSVRLRRVHDELQAALPTAASVTEVAIRWGFRHLSHFTTHYKRKFGELPSETLRKQ